MEIEKVIEEGPMVFSTIDLEVGKETNDYEIALSEHFGESRTYVSLARSVVVCLKNKPTLLENSDVFEMAFDELLDKTFLNLFDSLATTSKISKKVDDFFKLKREALYKEVSSELKAFTKEDVLLAIDLTTDTKTGVIFFFFVDVKGSVDTEKQIFKSEVIL